MDLSWNMIRSNYYLPHAEEMRTWPLINLVRDTKEWETAWRGYSVEDWECVPAEQRDAALNTLSERLGLAVEVVAFHATRAARSYDLNFEYSVGLG